jgi:cholesterol transport system auxiliary component
MRVLLPLSAALLLGGCFSFGAKPPPTLMTLDPAQSRPAGATRTAAEGETITVVTPTVPRELATVRVPVHENELAIAYVKNAQWVEQPANLFGRLVAETIAASGRVVLDPRQFTLDPGTRLTGQLQRFGVDATSSEAVAVYDAALARRGGGVVTRRFEARVPVAAVDVVNVRPALNQAANQIATEVAAWIGNPAS